MEELKRSLSIVEQRSDKAFSPVLDPRVLQFVLLDDIAVTLREIKGSLKREEFEGTPDERTLSADSEVKVIDLVKGYPHSPWATAAFANDGPDPVYIVVNGQAKQNVPPLNKNDSTHFDFTKADRKIEIIYYWCDTGKTASVRVRAKY